MHLLFFAAAALLLIVQVSVSKVFTFEVNVNPKIYWRSVESTASIGCDYFGVKRGKQSVKWKYNGQDITDRGGRVAVLDYYTSSYVQIKDVHLTDEGTYTCEASDSTTGEVKSSSGTLHVNEYKRLAVRSETEQQGKVGSTGTLLCEATGTPPVHMFWSLGKKIINTGPKYTKLGDRLLIRNVQKSDEGVYLCNAIQVSGRYEEYFKINYTVSTYYGALGIHSEKDQYGKIGSAGVIKCEVSGEPPIYVVWSFRGVILTDGLKYLQLDDRLIIYFVKPEDQGLYTCQAFQSVVSNVEILRINYHTS